MKRIIKITFPFIIALCSQFSAQSQTEQDAIMMGKQQFCTGILAGQSQFNQYWEGSFKRDNLNIGTIQSTAVGMMGNYGITSKLNALISFPYISNKATAGTLKGHHGIQDLNLWIKWMPIEEQTNYGLISFYFLGGYSTPLSNYIADYLQLAIGSKSKTVSGRMMLDYQIGSFFVTGSASYHLRSNIKIERNAYYTDQLILSDRVDLPNMNSWGIRTGYRNHGWIAEILYYQNTTLGGTDIRRNDMPFPSNKMNSTQLGFNLKYEFNSGLSLLANGNTTLRGRNVGASKSLQAGVVYIFDLSSLFSKKQVNDEKK